MTRLLAAIAAPALSVVILAAPVPKGKPAPDYFPTKVGTKRVYRMSGDPRREPSEHTFTVTDVKVKDGATVVALEREVGTARGRVAKFPWGTVRVSKAGVFHTDSFDPPLPVLRVPLTPGSSWKWEGTSNKERRSQTRTIKGMEVIKVPAGEFNAVRIEVVETRDGDEHIFRSTEWHAAGVGRVKWVSNNLTEELTAFTPGKE